MVQSAAVVAQLAVVVVAQLAAVVVAQLAAVVLVATVMVQLVICLHRVYFGLSHHRHSHLAHRMLEWMCRTVNGGVQDRHLQTVLQTVLVGPALVPEAGGDLRLLRRQTIPLPASFTTRCEIGGPQDDPRFSLRTHRGQ